ncbi:Spo0E like sporulation regulatory protein [Thermanaeromonas toyohensis ToBE]|uniref:Spo0E like sporulation regulatory protein n=1 Tax=Thermanaeromonas toyohensis ToBE TaxID=698762 RepID=A0A1W1VQH6_9FIRM|nr:aspartyl-phosphate phosphatase Spo0E family protein [Thermanaeromonas toyohensis]SMB95608.1 Spo0E like sporulation regulatory protein [Thermanaeromonas toyohensis ToBE]
MNKANILAQEIEKLRRQLEDVLSRGSRVDSQEVANLSRQIDAMVVEYTRLQRKYSK